MALRKYINGYMDRDTVILLFRDEAGRLMKKTAPAEHVAFFKTADVTANVKAIWDVDHRILSVKDEGEWTRVQFESGYWDPDKFNKFTGKNGMRVSHREEMCQDWERALKLKSFEADVSPLRRHMTDKRLDIATPRRCYIDLETDSRVSFPLAKAGRARILSWAIVSETGEKWAGILNADTNEDEIRLLSEMWERLNDYDQIVAWNGDGFDFPVMRERTKFLEVPVKDLRRWLYLDQLIVFKKYNMSNSDGGDQKQSFKLEAIAQSLLGEGKHDVDGSKTWQYWLAGGTEREKLLQYNIQDTDLLRRIEEKTGFLEQFQRICEVTGVFPDTKSVKPTVQVDGYLLRLGSERGVRFASKFYGSEDETTKFAGAFVLAPRTKGIEKDVFVADFASLYPSVMITFNLSPDTKIGIMAEGDDRLPNECLSPSNNVLTSNTANGVLVEALINLLALRAKWKKIQEGLTPGTQEYKDAKRRGDAFKLIANSFYGVMGTPFSRYYDRDICEATTQNGKWLILKTMEEAERRKWRVVYGDTDSLFVQGCNPLEFEEFVTWCNRVLYPDLLAKLGCRENRIKLACDKHFERMVMVTAKRYMGKFHGAKANQKPEIKGLEFMRGDANALARALQKEAIDLLVKGEEEPTAFVEMLERCKARVLTEPLAMEEVLLSKSLSKELEEYVTKTKQDGSESAALPHVQVARMLLERKQDISVGSRVAFVVVDGETPMTVIPAEDYTGECDRFYLWDNLIFPPTMRLLQAAFPDQDWTPWERTRPVKPRVKVDPNQLGLFAALSGVPETTVTVVETSQLVTGAPMVAPMRRKAAS